MEFTDPDVRARARQLRHYSTRAEQRLWRWLRDRRFGAHKFRRQHPIGRHVVDFYCRELKLVIEVDGEQNSMIGVKDMDTKRTLELRSYGLRVLRLTNEMVMRQSQIAGDCIRWAIERSLAER